ncbi:hypothetical protein C0J52_11229, partial [Blattella germanica]
GRPRVSHERVEEVRDAFVRSPSKSIRVASRQLNMSISTVHKVLRKRLHLYAYKLQLLHHIKPDDPARRESFDIDILDSIEAHPEYLSRICFSDESTFHVSGKVNKYNCRIWSSENPRVTIEMERDSQKIMSGVAW